jgi:putative transposase
MPRVTRTDVGNQVYHVLNRANARVQIFDNMKDYERFEQILEEAVNRYDMRLLAYCVMPNHWHLVLYPKQDRGLSSFMGWLTNTHTRRWHTAKDTIGEGHLYQGRYKSFLCQRDSHFLILVRYVERNAKQANLVKRAEDWQWSSAWRRDKGTGKQQKILSPWPVEMPREYLSWLNRPQSEKEEKAIELATQKGSPFGAEGWLKRAVKKYNLESTLHFPGRPKNGG